MRNITGWMTRLSWRRLNFNSRDRFNHSTDPIAPAFSVSVKAIVSFLGTSSLAIIVVGCTTSAEKINLSSGLSGGYYYRLGEQINASGTAVDLPIQTLESQGSTENLERLLNRKTDFALVQLDVASQAMEKGQVSSIVVLANEHIHAISNGDPKIKTFADLAGKRVWIGNPGSGIYLTASQLFKAAKLNIVPDENSTFDQALQKLKIKQLDALIYVGNIGTSEKLRAYFGENANLRLLPIPSNLVNYFTVRNPGSYQASVIPSGSYHANPSIPAIDTPTFSTATVLVTHPEIKPQKVALLTWAILSNSRKYAPFYPELANGDDKTLLQRGLFYIHPAAQTVFEYGDPRNVWLRYLQDNKPFQAAVMMFSLTSLIGFLIRHWRRQKSEKLIKGTRRAIAELRKLLQEDTEQTLMNVEQMRQQHRLMLIDGAVTPEIYDQAERMTKVLADQCRALQEKHRQEAIHKMLLLMDEWQSNLQTNPEVALDQLKVAHQKYREMLVNNQIDIQTYLQLKQLTLSSVRTLAPVYSSLAELDEVSHPKVRRIGRLHP